jgi:hypothetical protein
LHAFFWEFLLQDLVRKVQEKYPKDDDHSPKKTLKVDDSLKRMTGDRILAQFDLYTSFTDLWGIASFTLIIFFTLGIDISSDQELLKSGGALVLTLSLGFSIYQHLANQIKVLLKATMLDRSKEKNLLEHRKLRLNKEVNALQNAKQKEPAAGRLEEIKSALSNLEEELQMDKERPIIRPSQYLWLFVFLATDGFIRVMPSIGLASRLSERQSLDINNRTDSALAWFILLFFAQSLLAKALATWAEKYFFPLEFCSPHLSSGFLSAEGHPIGHFIESMMRWFGSLYLSIVLDDRDILDR